MANQSSITGPKIAPIFAVPRFWTMKRPTRIAMVMGMTYARKTGVAISSPSTALSTEMAGVIIPSPYSSDAPNRPTSTSICRRRRAVGDAGVTSAVSAIIPPSPPLSARITNTRYFTEMTRMSAHTMSDSSPSTLAWVAATPCTPCSDSRMA